MSLSELCRRCGLCCDGTLFARVPVEEAAAARLRGRLPVIGDALAQPCAALVGRACTVYDERPARCREFRCLLYAALADGEVDLAEAGAIVDEAHARVAAVAASLSEGTGGEDSNRLSEGTGEGRAAEGLDEAAGSTAGGGSTDRLSEGTGSTMARARRGAGSAGARARAEAHLRRYFLGRGG